MCGGRGNVFNWSLVTREEPLKRNNLLPYFVDVAIIHIYNDCILSSNNKASLF